MHKRLSLLGALAATMLVALSGVTAQARVVKPRAASANYVDPFTNPGWVPARTDMGVDWLVTRPLPVRAIGNAVILGSNSDDTGWPGGHFIWYRLLNGSHAGDIVYVAEHPHAPAPGRRPRPRRPEDCGGAARRDRDRVGLGRRRWRHARAPLLLRGRADRVRQGDGAVHEISWGTRPRPPGSRIRRAVRTALLTDRHLTDSRHARRPARVTTAPPPAAAQPR